jgi:hypothetical protein
MRAELDELVFVCAFLICLCVSRCDDTNHLFLGVPGVHEHHRHRELLALSRTASGSHGSQLAAEGNTFVQCVRVDKLLAEATPTISKGASKVLNRSIAGRTVATRSSANVAQVTRTQMTAHPQMATQSGRRLVRQLGIIPKGGIFWELIRISLFGCRKHQERSSEAERIHSAAAQLFYAGNKSRP